MTDQHDPDPTVVDSASVEPIRADPTVAGLTATEGGTGGPPSGGEPPDGSDTGDEQGLPWYQTPAGMVGIGLAIVLLGVAIGWLAFGGDDDGDDISSTSTTEPTPTTTVAPTTSAAPATTAAQTPTPPTDPPAGPGQAQGDLDSALARWQANSGRRYVFSYMLNAEGLTARLCVSGIAGDPTSVEDVTGACGDDVEPGGLGVDAWFDSIQAAINDGTLVSASYDPTTGHPTEVSIQPAEVDGAQMVTDFLQFQD